MAERWRCGTTNRTWAAPRPRVAVGPGARARLATRLSLRAVDAIDYFQKYDHSLSVGSHTWYTICGVRLYGIDLPSDGRLARLLISASSSSSRPSSRPRASAIAVRSFSLSPFSHTSCASLSLCVCLSVCLFVSLFLSVLALTLSQLLPACIVPRPTASHDSVSYRPGRSRPSCRRVNRRTSRRAAR